MKYPGSKGNMGLLRWLINRIPAHDVYMELFAGSAQLYRAKRPCRMSWLNDIDPATVTELKVSLGWQEYGPTGKHLGITNQPALEFVKGRGIGGSGLFIYLDPPYPRDARRSGRKLYRHEMMGDDEHMQLLAWCCEVSRQELPPRIMISTRENELYETCLALAGPEMWWKETFSTSDRGGACTEVIYRNYALPAILHQYDYIGEGYIHRQQVKRKLERLRAKLDELQAYERHLFIQELIKNDYAAAQHFMKEAEPPPGQRGYRPR